MDTRHYTPAIDVWALGVLFGELIYLEPMFQGGKPEPNGVAKDQLLKIFGKLGVPSTESWPSLHDLPGWRHAGEWPELAGLPSSADATRLLREVLVGRLRACRQPSPADCNNAVSALLAMLHLDPTRRVSCKDAKNLPFFSAFQPHLLRGNVLAEYSKAWQQVYPLRKECRCKNCLNGVVVK